ncbi:MAG: GSCFA domain-containing protein [Prevotella sp.]|nr:GSCFA domain-containing protein [Prevotella sp.]
MELQTKVNIVKSLFKISPTDRLLFVGSCFAENIGRRFVENQFDAVVNPYGTMYNPASVLHTVERCSLSPRPHSPSPALRAPSPQGAREKLPSFANGDDFEGSILTSSSPLGERVPVGQVRGRSRSAFSFAIITLGTNHVYILKETDEIVDNCMKRPQKLFREEKQSVDECADYLSRAVAILKERNPEVKVIFTVSPIRYAKYGFHGSQLSKATLLLAVDKLVTASPESISYFPAYEIMNDELRDYRFYQPDMLHPSEQAVDYIYERFAETYFSEEAKAMVTEWEPIKAALAHRPFNPDSEEHKAFLAKVTAKKEAFFAKWGKSINM